MKYARTFFHTLLVNIVISSLLVAPMAQARGSRNNVHQAADVVNDAHDGLLDGPQEVAMIDPSALEYIEFSEVTDESLTMVLGTISGCQFEVAFAPDVEPQVLAGEDGTCDFDTWLESATVLTEVSRVVSVWESAAWWEMFAYMAGESGSPDEDGVNAQGGDDYRSAEEVEELNDCGMAIGMAAFSAIGCGAGIGLAVGATGLTGGMMFATIAVAVSACGLTVLSGLQVADECGNSWRFYYGGSVEDWFDFVDVVQAEDYSSLTQVEDMSALYEEIEDLATDYNSYNYMVVDLVSTLSDANSGVFDDQGF